MGRKLPYMRQSPKDPHLFRKHFDDTQSPSTQMITFTEGPVDLGVQGGTFAPHHHLADTINLSKLRGHIQPFYYTVCIPIVFKIFRRHWTVLKRKLILATTASFVWLLSWFTIGWKRFWRSFLFYYAAVLPAWFSSLVIYSHFCFWPISEQPLSNLFLGVSRAAILVLFLKNIHVSE